MTKIIDSTNLGYLISKIKAAFWPKTDVVQIGLDDTPTANSDNLVKSGGVKSALDTKQNILVLGTSIKTINNESLLGSENISISSGSGGEANVIEAITFNGTPATITNKTAAITATIPVEVTESTAAQLEDLKLQCRLGYYGGAINGTTTYVEYDVPTGGITHYTYTFTVSGNTSIAVTIGSSSVTLPIRVKQNGNWVQATTIKVKNNGTWK